MSHPSRLLLALSLAMGALGVRSAAAQQKGVGPFDPKSGRFGSAVMMEVRRSPDTLMVTQARLWVALAQVYDKLGVPLTVIDTESHVIGALRATQRRPVAGERMSRLLECGMGSFGPNADRYTVQLTSLSYVEMLPDGRVALDTRVGGVASPNGLSSSVTCSSTGVLEDRILAELRKATGG